MLFSIIDNGGNFSFSIAGKLIQILWSEFNFLFTLSGKMENLLLVLDKIYLKIQELII